MISSVLISGGNKERNISVSRSVLSTITPEPTKILEVTTSGRQLYDGSETVNLTGNSQIDPMNLTQLGTSVSQWVGENSDGLVIVNDMMTLEMYHSKKALFRFFHLLSRRCESAGSHLVCVQSTSDSNNPFPQLFDFTVHTKSEENKFRIASTVPDDPPFSVRNFPTK